MLKDLILRVILAIEDNTALFYQQKVKEGYAQLERTLGLLMQTVDKISVDKFENKRINIDEQSLNMILDNAKTALESGDTILLSDILYFDIKSIFEDCLVK